MHRILIVLLMIPCGCAPVTGAGSLVPKVLIKPTDSLSPEEKSGLTVNPLSKSAGYGFSF